MKKILNTFFIAAIAISFNVNAAMMETLDGHVTWVLAGDEITDQVVEVAPGLFTDPILAYTSLPNSGASTETGWMTAVLDHIGDPYDPIFTLEKIEFETDADSDNYWTLLQDDIYTGDLTYGTSHYLIKIGEGNLTYDTFLYDNLDSLFQATITLGWLNEFSGLIDPDFDIYRVSHLSQVPIPAAFWLFGTALIGVVGFGKRKTAA